MDGKGNTCTSVSGLLSGIVPLHQGFLYKVNYF